MQNMPGRFFMGLVVVFMAAAISGCNKDIRDYCEKLIKCEGGNDNDEKACVESTKGSRRAAKEYDCKDRFDDMLACELDNSTCTDGSFDSGTDCDSEYEKYYDCLVKNSAIYSDTNYTY